MSIFNRKPAALEALRAAQENLERVKAIAPQERLRAIQNAGHHGGAEWHPCEDHDAQLIAEAELKVAEEAERFGSEEPEGVQLCAALDAALVSVRDALAPIKDDPEPTLASTPEAKAEYEERSAKHAEALKANAAARLQIKVDGFASFMKKVFSDRSNLVEAMSETVEGVKAKLAGVVDPEAPVLGDVSPVTVSALSRALAAHRVHIESNREKRQGIRDDLLPIIRAVSEAHVALRKKRREANLPSPELFRGLVCGNNPSLGHLANLAAGGELTPEYIDHYRKAIDCRLECAERPKAVLRDIAARRKAWDARQAEKAKARERNQNMFFGQDPAGKDVLVPRR